MYARVSEYDVLPGKLDSFVEAAQSVIPLIRQQPGFRALVVLRGPRSSTAQARIVSLWDSREDMKASEQSMFLYQALSRLMPFCKTFPPIDEVEVLASEFAAD